MAVQDLRTFASILALYVKQNMASLHRGAFMVRCVADGSLVAAIFGNDGYAGDEKTRREVGLVREWLREGQVEELGFGLTPDYSSWALLVRADTSRFQTPLGKAFCTEMFKAYLEDTVEAAWQSACGTQPSGLRNLFAPRQATR
jgi:hypothetical protein